ncbi:uncharacterized protein HMPREF1541_10747 [Cyphellophora europaea CBS 101466]|uniref:Heterokaryon incompatibility domain-containing protein n=1 Tax=Cyphellophora europaea (strain CBS 101466) TaxID=1220924 RepID=W2S659_CYPE1|nr:uncharacterized protein HMPREF1541_10747 [Cyphellophora europaea CBS 101466]ETN44196.1 hypothetical protein HMPREF1541_10747 [Cyphellophora europaea CBS 101466]
MDRLFHEGGNFFGTTLAGLTPDGEDITTITTTLTADEATSRPTDADGALEAVNTSASIASSSKQSLDPGEFRILKFSTVEVTSELRCVTSREELARAPAYVALSYSWGTVDVSHSIQVDDRTVNVSKTLFEALTSLRSQAIFEACDGNLWIDALSINQQDVAEKTQQVQMMAKIYQSATIVVGWLGQMTTSDRRGFETIRSVTETLRLGEVYDGLGNHVMNAPALASTFTLAEREGIPYVGHPAWESVAPIYEKSWWSRVWIIQELLHAQHFMFLCGETVIEDYILHFAANLARVPFLSQAMHEARGSGLGRFAASSLALWREEWIKGLRSNMLACLIRTVAAKSTDPRDKIFALVSLCNDIQPDFINYDYGLKEVLIGLAGVQLRKRAPNMDGLSIPQSFGRIEGVPSWVPCWAGATPTGVVDLAMTRFSALKHGTELPPCSDVFLQAVENTFILGIHTQKMDEIAVVLDTHVEGDVPSTKNIARDICSDDYYAWLCAFYRHQCRQHQLEWDLAELTEGLGTYPTGKPIEEVYWRSKIFDDQRARSSQIIAKHCALSREEMQETFPRVISLATEIREGEALGVHSSQHSFQQMQLCMSYEDLVRDIQFKRMADSDEYTERSPGGFRKYAVTVKGYVAWIPPNAEIGDELHMVDGARVPYILRRLYDKGEPEDYNVELVGDAYVHGLMSGNDIYSSDLLEAKQLVHIF